VNREITVVFRGAIRGAIKPLGFRSRGGCFQRQADRVIHLVQLQKSVTSSENLVRVTINLAIWVPILAEVRAGRPDPPSPAAAPWRERLGFAMQPPGDRWWTATSLAEAEAVASEMAAALLSFGIPALDSVASVEALKALWRAGISPGHAAKYRDYLLGRLERAEAAGGTQS
jgi:hypothetical protein